MIPKKHKDLEVQTTEILPSSKCSDNLSILFAFLTNMIWYDMIWYDMIWCVMVWCLEGGLEWPYLFYSGERHLLVLPRCALNLNHFFCLIVTWSTSVSQKHSTHGIEPWSYSIRDDVLIETVFHQFQESPALFSGAECKATFRSNLVREALAAIKGSLFSRVCFKKTHRFIV